MEISVVYCCDDKFVNVFCTSLESLLYNNHKREIHIYLIDNNISQKNKKKIVNHVENYKNASITFLPFPDLKNIFSMSIKFDDRHVSISTFGRLFISNLLPKKLERVIYLDCDTIICQDIAELYQYPLDGKILGGVDDCKSKKYRWVLGLPPNANYINAGVLLIDLSKWRKFNCEQRIINYICSHNGKIHFEDQGAINAVLNSEIKLLPIKYNVMTHFYDLNYQELLSFRNPVKEYKKEDITEILNNPYIIHYTSSFLTIGRAWNLNTNHKKRELFWKYMKQANVYEERIRFVPSGKKKILIEIQKYIPEKVILWLAIFMHEYIEPLKYYFIMRKCE